MKIFSLKNLMAIGAVIICVIVVSAGCKKESTDCKVVITVKQLLPNNDTSQTVSYARVIIAPDYPDVRVEGKSDASGQYTYIFKYEGILDVLASKPIAGTPDSLFGKGVIRLIPGETSYKTVFVK
jgi:hypothetical protein